MNEIAVTNTHANANVHADTTKRFAGEPLPAVAILSSGEPSSEVRLFVSQFYPRVQYIDGSCTNPLDLERARVKDARAVFVLPDGEDKDTDFVYEKDHDEVLGVMAIVHHLEASMGVTPQMRQTWPTIACQIQNLPKKNFLFDFGIRDLICTKEFETAVLGAGALVPGGCQCVMVLGWVGSQ